MSYPQTVNQRSSAEDDREDAYHRSGTMTSLRRSTAEDDREDAYLRSGAMSYPQAVSRRSDDVYDNLLNCDSLALGAIARINIAHRVLGKPEVTAQQTKDMASQSDDYVSNYWNSSMTHGSFWTTDQAAGKPNFMEGGQANGFGLTQSTYHKLHCLANIRMIFSWHITNNSDKMTRDMNVHTIHCLVSSAKPLEVYPW